MSIINSYLFFINSIQ